MTNLQLLLSIGIPSVLIALSWFNNNSRFTSMEKRQDMTDARIMALDAKVDRLDAKVDRRFDGFTEGMGSLRERIAVVENK